MTRLQPIKEWIGNLNRYPINTFILPGKCTIFTFHRVLSKAEYRNATLRESMAVYDYALRKFILDIKTRFHIISLQEFIAHQKTDSELSNDNAYACITFDDGWRDNYTHAFPILKELRVPATIFLSGSFISSNSGFWWQDLGDALCTEELTQDQKKALRNLFLPYINTSIIDLWDIDKIILSINQDHYHEATTLTEKALTITKNTPRSRGLEWSHCEEMSAHNISFGSHTLNHPRLSLLNATDLETELGKSKLLLQSKHINYVNAICYPYGDTSEKTLIAAKKHYDIGFTTQAGLSSLHLTSPMATPRINISNTLALKTGRLNYSLLRAFLRR